MKAVTYQGPGEVRVMDVAEPALNASGDAIVKGDDFSIVDFNDWPSFSRVRKEAARAIARRSILRLRRHPETRDLNV